MALPKTPRLIIFDLDDTLLDTSGWLIPVVNTKTFSERLEQKLPLLDGALSTLEYLQKKYQLALVTIGDPSLQKRKIELLSISNYFGRILLVDASTGKTKKQAFAEVSELQNISTDEILSIGNRRSTDIRPAKQLGMTTCLFVYGEHQNEAIEEPEDIPDFLVHGYRDLIETCGL